MSSSSEHEFDPSKFKENDLWAVVRIVSERKGQYKVKWDGVDPKTNKPWPDSWEKKSNVTSDLVEEWKASKKKGLNKETKSRKSNKRERSSTAGDVEEEPREASPKKRRRIDIAVWDELPNGRPAGRANRNQKRVAVEGSKVNGNVKGKESVEKSDEEEDSSKHDLAGRNKIANKPSRNQTRTNSLEHIKANGFPVAPPKPKKSSPKNVPPPKSVRRKPGPGRNSATFKLPKKRSTSQESSAEENEGEKVAKLIKFNGKTLPRSRFAPAKSKSSASSSNSKIQNSPKEMELPEETPEHILSPGAELRLARFDETSLDESYYSMRSDLEDANIEPSAPKLPADDPADIPNEPSPPPFPAKKSENLSPKFSRRSHSSAASALNDSFRQGVVPATETQSSSNHTQSQQPAPPVPPAKSAQTDARGIAGGKPNLVKSLKRVADSVQSPFPTPDAPASSIEQFSSPEKGARQVVRVGLKEPKTGNSSLEGKAKMMRASGQTLAKEDARERERERKAAKGPKVDLGAILRGKGKEGVQVSNPDDVLEDEEENTYSDSDPGLGAVAGADALTDVLALRREEEESTQDLLRDGAGQLGIPDLEPLRPEEQELVETQEREGARTSAEPEVSPEPSQPTRPTTPSQESPSKNGIEHALSLLNAKSEEIKLLETSVAEKDARLKALTHQVQHLQEALGVQMRKVKALEEEAKVAAVALSNPDWEYERKSMTAQIELLTQQKKDAINDADFFRKQWNEASGFVSNTQKENEELEKRAKIAEGTTKEGLRLFQATYTERIKNLEGDIREEKSKNRILVLLDQRTRGEDIRRRAEQAVRLRVVNQRLKEEIEELKIQNQLNEEAYEEEMAKVKARLVGALCNHEEGSYESVYECKGQLKGGEECADKFRTIQELESHIFEARHFPEFLALTP